MVSHWSLSDSKSPQVPRTLISILPDLNNTIVWMISTCPLISMSSNPCTNPSVTVQIAPITICITVTFMFYSFSIPWQGPGTNFSFRFLSILLCGQPKQQNPQFSKLFCWVLLGLVAWPRLGDPFVSQNPRVVCVSHSPGKILGFAYTIIPYGHISISGTIPNKSLSPPSCFYSYTLSALIIICCIRLLWDWLFRLYRHMIYICCFVVLSILTLILLLLMALFWVAIWRDSVSFFRFPFFFLATPPRLLVRNVAYYLCCYYLLRFKTSKWHLIAD